MIILPILFNIKSIRLLLIASLIGASGQWPCCVLAENLPSAVPPPQVAFRVVQTFPHDPGAFTQGLLYYDGDLYESTGGYGASSLRRVALESGAVLQKKRLPAQYFGEGLALFDDFLIQLTWKAGKALVYDRHSFEQVDVHHYTGEGWGLTVAEDDLLMSDGSAWLRRLHPRTFAEIDRLQVTENGQPLRGLNELEWIHGRIWANVYPTSRIVIIHPQTGAVEGWLDGGGLMGPRRLPADAVLNGIAFDAEGDRIFITGKLWPLIFEISLENVRRF